MAKLIDAVLALDVELEESGIKSISNRIFDRAELGYKTLPRVFTVWVVFKFEGLPNATFKVAIKVLSLTGRPLWFDSGSLQLPPSGDGEFARQVSFSVSEVGPYKVLLLFDTEEVWRHTVFFALSGSGQ